MKKIFIFILCIPAYLFGQESNSWEGRGLLYNSKCRTLNIFINVIYDVHSDTNNIYENSVYWLPLSDTLLSGVNKQGTIPSYLPDFLDTAYNADNLCGCMTRLYGESSFDSLQITGDFVVVNVRESKIIADPTPVDLLYCHPEAHFCYNKICKVAIDMINEEGGLTTLYGHDRISDYDINHLERLFFTNVFIRNITAGYGGISSGSGFGSYCVNNLKIGNGYYNAQKGTLQCIGDNNLSKNPTSIVIHEFAHSLFGSNDYHTSGGNHRRGGCTMPFINIQGGYGLMGAANSGLVGCNGYERWRMHWKHPASIDYIAARDKRNLSSVISDISKEDGNVSFILRDFVTYGDVIRIKLPYKDLTTTPNQYLWLEFHNIGNNQKLDFLQGSNESCLYQGTAGIYAYYQVGRDILSGSQSDVWDNNNRDNLRVISNQGYWDYTEHSLLQDTDVVCTQWKSSNLYYVPEYSNAFCGYQDQEKFIIPKKYEDSLELTRDSVFVNGQFAQMQNTIREYTAHNIKIGDHYITNSISFIGDSMDAFSSHRKINMGTNPSTCNTKTYYSNNQSGHLTFNTNQQLNNQTTYLSGLSIEMIPIETSSYYLVKIRWDDFDIVNDARWTGKIVLKEQLNLKRGNRILLAQNRTPAQKHRNSESGYFADPTLFTCEVGSRLIQEPRSSIVLTEKSCMVLDSGCHYIIQDSANLILQSGSSFILHKGSDFQIGAYSTIVIDSLSVAYIYDTAKIHSNAHIIVRPGGKLVVNGGTLTSACDGEMWQGIEIMGDRTKHQLSAYQGVVELKNGAVIENAYNALRTGYGENYWSTTGGIIRADSAFFRNNQRSVELLSYADTIASGTIRNNFSYFKKCTFIVDTNNLFGATGCTFYNHISMWDVKGIQITGCHFSNAMSNLVTNRGRAIYTLDAGFSIKTACNNPANMLIECSCPEYWATHNTFEGFSTAINANTSGSQYAITIDEADFMRNNTDITINGNNAVTITRNTFNLSSIPYYTRSGAGLVLNSCTGFKVEGNNFYRAAYTANLNYKGISANNLGTAANNLYLNKFTNLNYGIYITGANGNRTTGLLCSCDTFNHNQFDILLNRSSSILQSQGSSRKGADNSFYSTQSSSLRNFGSQSIYYYYSIGGQHSPKSPTPSITLDSAATANTCASTLCNNLVIPNRAGSSYTAMRNQYDSLLNVFEEQDYASVLDNADAVSGVYTTATLSAAQSTQAMLLSLGQSLYETSQTAVRQIMQDSILRLADLEDWHTAMPGISARYALAETQYQNGESNALTLHGIPTSFALTTAERDEYDNYLDFNTLKTSLTPVGWLNATDAQIAELQRIAELNTGRASEMAKGVLCFFFDICYDNTVEDNTTDEAPRYGNAGNQLETMSDDILVYPNPTTGQIEITTVKSELKIKDISVTDIYGKIIYTQFINDYFGTADLSSLTAGIYVLRATMEDGSVAVRKVMKQ